METATYQHAHLDPAVAGIVSKLTENLERLRDTLLAAKDGPSSFEKNLIPEDRHEAFYGLARKLCNEGEFRHALPIALQLALRSGESRFAFLAASCLQRLGQSDFAASMYSACLLIAPGHVAAMFRLGECFAAMGDAENAIDSFESAIEMGRSDSAHRCIQDMAAAKLAKLRAVKR
jgi:tetratricopeptide (TPR) repeat protein